MRTVALLAAILLASGGLAGCVGEDKDPVNTNTVDSKNPAGGGTDAGQVLKVLAPLTSSISTKSATWVAPGSLVDVEASAPANAEGNLTVTWAIGQHPFVGKAPEAALDTKVIGPGESKSLTYELAGSYLMHCHPHPYMKHNVTVVEGFEGPSAVTVSIVDGDSPETYRFVPENILIAPGTKVTYTNKGSQPHTSTLESASPTLKKLDATTLAGQVKVEGDGWMRLVAVMQDAKGRIGVSEYPIYVKDIPANFAGSYSGGFDAAFTPPADPGAGSETFNPSESHDLKLDLGGKAFINVTVDDPSGENLQQVKVHLVEAGATQDSMTLNAGELTAAGTVNAGAYKLVVEGAQGIQISYTVTVDVLYALVPPVLEMAMDMPADGHGGHNH